MTIASEQRTWHSLIQGVAFFFVLSGFVLTYRYGNLASWKETALFYCYRFARIAPLYFLTAIPFIVLPGLQHFGSEPLKEVFLYTFALQDWSNTLPSQTIINPPAHSISSETFFYLLFPLLALPRKPLAIALPCLAAVLSIWAWNQNHATGGLNFMPIFGLAYFVAGVISARLFARFKLAAQKFKGGLGTFVFTAAELLCLLPIVPLSIKTTDSPASELIFTLCGFDIDCSAVFPASLALNFACVLIVFACQRGLLSRLLKLRQLVFLGNISFAFFLFHYGVLMACHNVLGLIPADETPVLCLKAFSFSLVVSAVLYGCVEEPARRLIARQARKILKAPA